MRYEENPFVEVEKLADGVWSLLSPGGCPTLCYLVEGTEKAMLIDTGFGVGDTKALCERLTDKPLVVVDRLAAALHKDIEETVEQYRREKAQAQVLQGER